MVAISSATADIRPSKWSSGPAIVAYIALATLALHMFIQNYGFFRDELYFLACGDHLAWGYMDQPPMVALLARASTSLFGHSLYGIHVLPALVGVAQVWLAGVLVREFKGGRFAQALAAVATALAPQYLGVDAYLSMNCLEPLFWMGMAYVFVRIVNTGRQRLWLVFGIVAGLSLENKYATLVFGFALVVGVLLTEQRKALATPWMWVGGAIAALIFLPNVLWQYHYGFPFIEMQQQFVQGKNVIISPWQLFTDQVLVMNPMTFPLWVGGLLFFFTNTGKPWRALGWTYVLTFMIFTVQKGTKSYYLTPIYIMLYAGGAVLLECWLASRKPGPALRLIGPAYLALVLIAAGILAPYAICLLPPQKFIAYMNVLHVRPPKNEQYAQNPVLPQQYADMFGWPEMVEKVATYYNALPAAERAKTAIYGKNYGESGAIDWFGGAYGLPKSIGTHMNYWVWGPRDYTGESVIIIGQRDYEKLFTQCASVTKVADLDHPLAMPYENRPMWHCRGLNVDLRRAWPEMKEY
jgi:hypothetical protein